MASEAPSASIDPSRGATIAAGSAAYWEQRYAAGGNSGGGSYGRLAEFKAGVLNGLVARLGIRSLIEFGCGDGNQLSLAHYPAYLGLDVSPTALALCRARFAGDPAKRFALVEEAPDAVAELALSLDVIFHLVEDEVFEAHLRRLFAAAEHHVVIYASDRDADAAEPHAPHVRHRGVTAWIAAHIPDVLLAERIPNAFPPTLDDGGETSFCDFFHYRKIVPDLPA